MSSRRFPFPSLLEVRWITELSECRKLDKVGFRRSTHRASGSAELAKAAHAYKKVKKEGWDPRLALRFGDAQGKAQVEALVGLF